MLTMVSCNLIGSILLYICCVNRFIFHVCRSSIEYKHNNTRRDCAPANSTAPPASVSSDQKPIKPKYGPRPIPDEWLENHIPATQPYAAEDVMRDLLVFAAKNLRVGGRVVYLLPTTYDYTDADLPTHPQLRVVGNSEERLTSKYARRLITMVKTVETSDIPSNLDDGFKSDFSFAKLREKIVASNKKPKTASD